MVKILKKITNENAGITAETDISREQSKKNSKKTFSFATSIYKYKKTFYLTRKL